MACIRRFAILVSAAGLSAAALAQTTPVSPAAESATSASMSPSRRSSESAMLLLRKPIESVDWLEIPFEDVLEWLRDLGEGQVNIVPRWPSLNVEGVDQNTLVTLQLNNTKVAQVLNECMEILAPTGEITYRAMGNTLKISTKTDFSRKMYFRIYDATDILFRVPNMGREAPIIDLQRTGGSGGGGGGGGGGQSVFSGSSSGGGSQEEAGQQAEQDLRERLENLQKLIEEIVEPDSWETANTGGKGRIRIYNRSLIVFNTIEVHEIIAGTFAFE